VGTLNLYAIFPLQYLFGKIPGGVYWMPLCELLEARGVHVLRIDPRQATRAPGRPKTDRLDCTWLQRLHA
jgi:transposase